MQLMITIIKLNLIHNQQGTYEAYSKNGPALNRLVRIKRVVLRNSGDTKNNYLQ